jgi:hypothetical protein
MLMITQDAAEAIAQALAQEPDHSGFRIAKLLAERVGAGDTDGARLGAGG